MITFMPVKCSILYSNAQDGGSLEGKDERGSDLVRKCDTLWELTCLCTSRSDLI